MHAANDSAFEESQGLRCPSRGVSSVKVLALIVQQSAPPSIGKCTEPQAETGAYLAESLLLSICEYTATALCLRRHVAAN